MEGEVKGDARIGRERGRGTQGRSSPLWNGIGCSLDIKVEFQATLRRY